MENAINYLRKHLPEHEVALKARPDGKLLMSLSQNGTSIYMKAINPCALISDKDLKTIVDEFNLTREMTTGNIRWEDVGKKILQSPLPTFSGSPINPTAAKMLWKKRQAMALAAR
ncbi:hypothetical protein I5L51_04390 [Pseudomonas mendocina]|uniref:hypothetical protein n=1 Tax=Pseudomonas sp. UBA6323 TaxID=1947329 RepID=UPI0018D76A31|nr:MULTISPECIES: hypothetical protein [Pseudomonas]MBH3338346.1 hypothetical protein [Pseudomonas mendocina]